MNNLQLQLTADGSHTLYIPELDEHYHSVNGAVQESKHVYIDAAFNQCSVESVTVLELGFGTGLNTLLTALEAEKRKIKTNFISLEKFPLSKEITDNLNYSGLDEKLFRKIHSSSWEIPEIISPYFSLQKIETDFADYRFPDKVDIVYYDAFAPDKQEGVWSQELFDKIYLVMNSPGVLTTYCAKGNIRRMMQNAGFTVERIPGPPGKREMLRARK